MRLFVLYVLAIISKTASLIYDPIVALGIRRGVALKSLKSVKDLKRRRKLLPLAAVQMKVQGAIGELFDAHDDWKKTSVAARVDILKDIVATVESADWDDAGGWLNAEMELIKMARDPSAANLKSNTRLLVATTVKSWCSSLIDSLGGQRIDGDSPRPMGLSAPGVTFKVKVNKGGTSAFEKQEVRPNADRYVTLVLGAGNQSFLTLVDVLDRVFNVSLEMFLTCSINLAYLRTTSPPTRRAQSTEKSC